MVGLKQSCSSATCSHRYHRLLLSSGRWGGFDISPEWRNLAANSAAWVCLPATQHQYVKQRALHPFLLKYVQQAFEVWDSLWPPSAGNRNVTPFCIPDREQTAILRDRRAMRSPQKQPLNYIQKRVATSTQPILHFIVRRVPLYR